MAKIPNKPWLKEKNNLPQQKDDGTRWMVIRDNKPVYVSLGGVTRDEAERLARGLQEPAKIKQVK